MPAFEYDWRTRFGLALDTLGTSMGWGEARRMTVMLMSDPSSQVFASMAGWDYPISREALVLLDLYDLDHLIANQGKRVKPHPMRPSVKRKRERRGREQVLTPDEIVAVLRRAGHTAPLPTIESLTSGAAASP